MSRQLNPRKVNQVQTSLAVSVVDFAFWAKTPSTASTTGFDELIYASQDWVEAETKYSLFDSQWYADCEAFCAPVRVLLRNATAINAIFYYDEDEVLQTLPTANYVARFDNRGVWIDFKDIDISLSETMPYPILIDLQAGYASAAEIPYDLRLAVKQLALHYHENRSATYEGTLTEVPLNVERIIDKWRVF